MRCTVVFQNGAIFPGNLLKLFHQEGATRHRCGHMEWNPVVQIQIDLHSSSVFTKNAFIWSFQNSLTSKSTFINGLMTSVSRHERSYGWIKTVADPIQGRDPGERPRGTGRPAFLGGLKDWFLFGQTHVLFLGWPHPPFYSGQPPCILVKFCMPLQ